MNEFIFTIMRRVFVRFLEEIEDTKKTFQNYLTFSDLDFCVILSIVPLRSHFVSSAH